jgi:hypothetical protein
MAKAFYSFHFDKDIVRVGQVRNMGAVQGDQIVDDNSWEQVKRGGAAAIQSWIDRQMPSTDVVVVLVGRETAQRHWVDYEIRKAWNSYKPLLGIRIHGLKDFAGQTALAGANPFENVTLDGGTLLSTFVPLHQPSGGDSKAVYAAIQANLKTWISNAPRRSKS